jgi:hypothetical protein
MGCWRGPTNPCLEVRMERESPQVRLQKDIITNETLNGKCRIVLLIA